MESDKGETGLNVTIEKYFAVKFNNVYIYIIDDLYILIASYYITPDNPEIFTIHLTKTE